VLAGDGAIAWRVVGRGAITSTMIVLVRHGETEGNRNRVLQLAGTPLNQHGILQAASLAQRLSSLPIAHVLCSDMPRARMTAQPFLERSGANVEYSELLQERNFGDLRGTPYGELSFDPFALDYVPPHGESWLAFHERVARAFAWMLARRAPLQGHLLVVTHGLMCRAVVERHAHVPGHLSVPERFDNTSVTLLEPMPVASDREHAGTLRHTARLVNCCSHLRGMSRAKGPV
jgi:probable phosphoglycerate mutase